MNDCSYEEEDLYRYYVVGGIFRGLDGKDEKRREIRRCGRKGAFK